MDKKFNVHSMIYKKYLPQFTPEKYNDKILNQLIQTKNCHIVVRLKETMIFYYIEEFLKRYYTKKESQERIPKFVNYYRNYLKFFCRPTFRNLTLNDIIQTYGEKCAEIYYNKNYGKEKPKKKQVANDLKTIFTDTIKESINNISNLNDDTNTSTATINTTQLNQSNYQLTPYNNLIDVNNDSIAALLSEMSGKHIQLIAKDKTIKAIQEKIKFKLKHVKNSNSSQIKAQKKPIPSIIISSNGQNGHKKTLSKISIDTTTHITTASSTARKKTNVKMDFIYKSPTVTYNSGSSSTTGKKLKTSGIFRPINKLNKPMSRNEKVKNNINFYSTNGFQGKVFSTFNNFEKQQQLLNNKKRVSINSLSNRNNHFSYSNTNNNMFRSTTKTSFGMYKLSKSPGVVLKLSKK